MDFTVTFSESVTSVDKTDFTLTTTSGISGASVSSTAFTYINKSGVTQFRLRFQKDDNDDLGADYLKFYSVDCASSTAQAFLEVKYYVP